MKRTGKDVTESAWRLAEGALEEDSWSGHLLPNEERMVKICATELMEITSEYVEGLRSGVKPSTQQLAKDIEQVLRELLATATGRE